MRTLVPVVMLFTIQNRTFSETMPAHLEREVRNACADLRQRLREPHGTVLQPKQCEALQLRHCSEGAQHIPCEPAASVTLQACSYLAMSMKHRLDYSTLLAVRAHCT